MGNPLARIAHDLRHARRGLRRRKAFALTAIASLALGIGAASVLNERFSLCQSRKFGYDTLISGRPVEVSWRNTKRSGLG